MALHAPLASEVLGDNGNETLERAQDGTMDDDWARRGLTRLNSSSLVSGTVLEIEPLGQLEVELDRRALEGALQRVADRDVDLGPVEGAVARVQLPLAWVELVEAGAQLLWVGGGSVRTRRRIGWGWLTSSAWSHVLSSPR